MTRGDIAKHNINISEQDIRIDYYSGLLAEAKTVQEEEEERLQELTAFQQFLAAVTPSQSLKDLKRKIHEIHEKVKVMPRRSEDRSSPDKESQGDVRTSEPTVSAGIGQEALLALLEARVTDLCAQLNNTDPGLRDAVFLNHEQFC
ncbi:hypothetical protein O3P69_006467 [Scylla paramamosain]|uniref:Uncharacterized protein n=1 Tax=Scylla paramamosain TaxID=85552 RepID=A0AAW0U405_SCYPA